MARKLSSKSFKMHSLTNNRISILPVKLIRVIWSYLFLHVILISLYSCQGEQPSSTVSAVSNSSNDGTYITYLRDSVIVVQSDSITVPVQIHDYAGSQLMNPAVSPDGLQIAYTRIMNANDARTICLMDLSTRRSNQLAVPSSNFYGPAWSPDSEWILFNIFQKKGVWKPGIIKRNNNGYRMLDSASGVNYYSPTWRSAERIAAQDLEKLYTLGLDGKIIETILLDSLIGVDFSRSSDDRYYFTSNQKEIIFQVGTQSELPDLKGPLQSVYRVRVADGKLTRLTPAGFHVRNLFVANNDRIYCEGSSAPFTEFELVELLPSGELQRWSRTGTSTSIVTKGTGSIE